MRCKTYAALVAVLLFTSVLYSQTTYFVKYKSNVPASSVDRMVSSQEILSSSKKSFSVNSVNYRIDYFARGLERNNAVLGRIVKLSFNDSVSAVNIISSLQNDPTVQFVEKEAVYKIDGINGIPNDSLAPDQWALENIKAFDAWNITEGSDTVIIGLIDTGVDYLHPDLKNKMFINPGETGTDAGGKNKSSNGIDDDGNGFIDDYIGWDFTDQKEFPYDSASGDYTGWDNNPMDENGHGTAVAGIIGAETNNVIGIAGTAPRVRILDLRAFDPSGYGRENDVASAILYAVKMGAKVINMSFGDSKFSEVLRDVIKYAYEKNVVLVASSGNSGSSEPHYPSGYSEVISVGNSTQDDRVSESSNYGSTLDLVAPGTGILTTTMEGGYGYVSGTSASAPFVSAAAGLILSTHNFSNEEVKQILKSTADDIGDAGWDEKSGAGRLDIFNALNSTLPSVIKFNSPTEDFTLSSDTLHVLATILSAKFLNYSLSYGTGLNPETWTILIPKGEYQVKDKNIYNLNTASLPDTSYTLKLVVNLNNGRAEVENVNFYIMRNPPVLNAAYAGNIIYGNKATILGAVSSNQRCSVKMYYRKEGDESFNYVSLDNFTPNIKTIDYFHYGMIPLSVVSPNSKYQVYFEAENLAGRKSVLKNEGNYFEFNTNLDETPVAKSGMKYTLPPGFIYENPLDLTSGKYDEIAVRPYTDAANTEIYKLEGASFKPVTILKNKIIKSYGDFNGNGRKDFLCSFVNSGYILEQSSSSSPDVTAKFADSSGNFRPALAADLYGDGNTEIISISGNTGFDVWNLSPNLTPVDSVYLENFSPEGSGYNYIDSPHAVITDMNGDGVKEIWAADMDGDLFSYNIKGPGKFEKGRTISTGLDGSSAYLTAGDYTGDGKMEMAVLLHSLGSGTSAPYYRLWVFDYANDTLHTVLKKDFIDLASDFNNNFQETYNSLRFVNLQNSGKEELALFIFPYSYIFKYSNNKNKIISFGEHINSNSVFAGDLNGDGINEIAFPGDNGIKFYQFDAGTNIAEPYNLTGFSIDSSSISLSWQGASPIYYIYRGLSSSDLSLIDSTSGNSYTDKGLNSNEIYYYGVSSMQTDSTGSINNIIKIFSHNPARLISVAANGMENLLLTFSNKINNTIANINAFEVIPGIYPNTVSAASQFSYQLNFMDALPAGEGKILVTGLKDFYGSPIKSDTISFINQTEKKADNFYISEYSIPDPYTVKLTMSLDVTPASAADTSNYIFSPQNYLSRAAVDPNDNRIIYLYLQHKRPVGSTGLTYTLKVQNLISSAGNGNLVISTGAGSVIELSASAENLSDVYVYPSPARLNSAVPKLTFANLPAEVKITIFSISGRKIRQLEGETSGGGMDYDLKDDSGSYLRSGVYIYRIVQLDNNGNEKEEKLGKFAVIK